MTTKIKHIASNIITTAELDTSSLDSHFSGGTGVTYSSGAISIGQAVAASDSPTFADLTITGNLNITGNIDQYNVTDLDVTDKTITLGSGQIEANSGGSGIIIDGSSASLLWDETNTEWDFNNPINVSGGITAAGNISTESTGNPYIQVKSTGAGNNPYIRIQADTNYWDLQSIFSNADDELDFRYNGTSKLEIDKNGNTVIAGTISSGVVTATVASPNPKLKAAYNSSNYIGISHEKINVQGGGVGLIIQGNGVDRATFASGGGLTLANGDLTLTSGSVSAGAISGTSLSIDTLSMNGSSIGSSGNMTLDSANSIILDADGGDIMLKDNSVWFGNFNHNGTNLRIDAKETNGNIHLNPNGTGSVNVLSSLMVGATTAPQDYLEIDGSGNGLGGLTISNSTHNHAALSFARSSSATARIFISEPNALHTSKMYFQTSDASGSSPNLVTAMVIADDQNVGIGTASPNEKLEVSGTALVENAKLKAIAESNSDTAVDVFVYDTRKDSDGGAWRKRTQHTSWYNETLNTSTRGARKEFPCVAVIVAESNQVTIYDGDDPDMPMWMVFNAGSNNMIRTAAISSFSVINGEMYLGLQTNGDLSYISFIKDRARWITASTAYGGFYKQGGIDKRNDSSAYGYYNNVAGISDITIVNSMVNDVAMTVLPNAPIDADTGLPVPTIAVATNGGVSIIKDDGNVVDITNIQDSSTFNFCQDVHFRSDGGLVWSADSTGNSSAPRFIQVLHEIPTSNFVHTSVASSSNIDEFYSRNTTSQGDLKFISKLGLQALQQSTGRTNVGTTDGLSSFAYNKAAPEEGLANYINTDYNTGWMVGDIKLATLSDTDTTNAGAEIVTNGDFATNSDWTLGAGWSIAGGKATHDSTTGNRYLTQGGILEEGKQYVLIFTISDYTSGTLRIYGGTTQPVDITEGVATYTIPFIAASGGDVNFQSSVSAAFVGSISNVSCKLAEQDRSVNGNGLQVFGTVTKTAVATGADLVAYSGFNSSNSLQTAHDSAFAVGTEFSASMWLKGGSAGQSPFSVESSSSSINDTDSTILVHTHADGFYFYTRGANDSSWHATGAASIQSTNVALTPWHMVTISQDSAGRKLYIDGKLNVSDGVVKTIDGVEGTLVVTCGGRPTFTQNYTGNMALVRFSGTPVTPEQVAKIYNDEKHLFQENAKATLYGTSDAVKALAYDDDTELLHVGTSAGRSEFQGLRRVNNTTDAVSAAISASNGLIVED